MSLALARVREHRPYARLTRGRRAASQCCGPAGSLARAAATRLLLDEPGGRNRPVDEPVGAFVGSPMRSLQPRG